MSESLDAWDDPGIHRTPEDIVTTARCHTPTRPCNGTYRPIFPLHPSDGPIADHQSDDRSRSIDCISEDTLTTEHGSHEEGNDPRDTELTTSQKATGKAIQSN